MGAIKSLFGILNSVIKGTASGLKQTRGGSSLYSDLIDTPYLYHSDHIKQLADRALKAHNNEQLQIIRDYLQRFEVTDIPSYRSILRKILRNHRFKSPVSLDDTIHLIKEFFV